MKKVTIQAFEDTARAEGGHAVILLAGLAAPKNPVIFRIRSADTAHRAGGGGGWIGGDHTPVSVRPTDQGVEIVAGPGVTESEHLMPGTVVEIEVPACGVRGEFLWPNIAPLLRPRRKTIVVKSPRGAAGRPGRIELEQGGGGTPDSDASRARASDDAGAARENAVKPDASELRTSAAVPVDADPASTPAHAPAEADFETPEPLAAKAGAPEVTRPASEGQEPDHTNEAVMTDRETGRVRAVENDPQHIAEEIANKHGWAFRRDVNVMMSKKFFALGSSRHDTVQSEAIATAGKSTHHNIAAEANAILAHSEESPASAIGADTAHYDLPPVAVYEPEPLPHAGSGETFYPHARGSIIAPAGQPPRPEPRKGSPVNAGIAAALGTLVVGGLAAAALLSGQPTISDAGASLGTMAGAGTPAAAAMAADPALFDALSAGTTSPRGTSSAGVSPAKALEAANNHLLATGAARDTEEGAFWLKHYIAATLGDDRTMRVLTQLGSVYAEPQGRTPDYAKARLLWEIASAAGDPVAMCFLGLLHESGLGVAADKKTSRQWYERSKSKGGCPNVDEQIARVSQ